ncbi:hypothetical protein AB4571_18630 [Vibrio breoganii]|uniref:hypothetical protein n=1 Tax=Vibrio breoganii TaxID=553239 RepID=UPI000C85B9A1|nr:hypothetical protein [Vibrio breoganii]PML13810.1 hypothetical protein BCT84_12520 [Vibrio breoganii]
MEVLWVKSESGVVTYRLGGAGSIAAVSVPENPVEAEVCKLTFAFNAEETFRWVGTKGFNEDDLKKSVMNSRVFVAEQKGWDLSFIGLHLADEWCSECETEGQVTTDGKGKCDCCGRTTLPCSQCLNDHICDWSNEGCTPFPRVAA